MPLCSLSIVCLSINVYPFVFTCIMMVCIEKAKIEVERQRK